LPKFTGSTTIGDSNLINSSGGNLGLGVTPSSWFSDRRGLQVQSGGSINGSPSTVSFVELGANFFHGNSGDTYIGSSQSTKYRQLSGFHEWYIAPSGTAGNAISFTQAMTLTSGGNLLVGTTTDNGARLQVKGSAGNGIILRHSNDNVIALLEELSGAQGAALTLRNSSATNTIQFNAGGTSFINGGNVGIGTATTIGLLTLGGAGGGQYISGRDNTTGYEIGYLQFNSDNITINPQGGSSGNDNFIRLLTAGTPRIVITTGGNVLIGTSINGASKLRIVGLPTSAAGLSSGDVYNLAGVLMIA
jgi:hypothetical protein